MENKVVIHGRYAPDGTIAEIGERPQGLNPQQWFDKLFENFPNNYQGMMGARLCFHLTREQVDSLKASLVKA